VYGSVCDGGCCLCMAFAMRDRRHDVAIDRHLFFRLFGLVGVFGWGSCLSFLSVSVSVSHLLDAESWSSGSAV